MAAGDELVFNAGWGRPAAGETDPAIAGIPGCGIAGCAATALLFSWFTPAAGEDGGITGCAGFTAGAG